MTNNHQRGFSLLEVLVAMGIMSITIVIASAAMNSIARTRMSSQNRLVSNAIGLSMTGEIATSVASMQFGTTSLAASDHIKYFTSHVAANEKNDVLNLGFDRVGICRSGDCSSSNSPATQQGRGQMGVKISPLADRAKSDSGQAQPFRGLFLFTVAVDHPSLGGTKYYQTIVAP